MPKVTPLLNSFSSGEISPLLEGRTDIEQYFRSVKTMENFIPMPWGGTTRRPGTTYIAEVKDSNETARLIPFQFNVEQAYMLEFGDRYIRFIMDGGQLVETEKDITGATNADPCVITVAGHGYASGDRVWLSGLEGITELNGRWFDITYIGVNSFSLDDCDSTLYGAYVAPGANPDLFTGGAVTQSSYYQNNAAYNGAKAFDDDNATSTEDSSDLF